MKYNKRILNLYLNTYITFIHLLLDFSSVEFLLVKY